MKILWVLLQNKSLHGLQQVLGGVYLSMGQPKALSNGRKFTHFPRVLSHLGYKLFLVRGQSTKLQAGWAVYILHCCFVSCSKVHNHAPLTVHPNIGNQVSSFMYFLVPFPTLYMYIYMRSSVCRLHESRMDPMKGEKEFWRVVRGKQNAYDFKVEEGTTRGRKF